MEDLTKEGLLASLDFELNRLKKWQEEVAGSWNGKESGLQEERSVLAKEIIEKITELQIVLAELEESF